MDKLKQWVALSVVAALAVLAAGWVLLISPKRSDAADLHAQAADQQHGNDQLRTQLVVLAAQAKDLPAKQAELAAVATKLPGDAAQPALLRALAAAADTAHVELVSVAPGPLAPVVTAAPAAAPAAADSTATTATAPSGTATSATATSATGTAGTLLAMPLTISVFGGYYETQQFIAALEDLPRALRITGLAVAPGQSPSQAAAATAAPANAAPTGSAGTAVLEDGRHLLTSITGSVYVAAGAAPATAVVAPAATPAK